MIAKGCGYTWMVLFLGFGLFSMVQADSGRFLEEDTHQPRSFDLTADDRTLPEHDRSALRQAGHAEVSSMQSGQETSVTVEQQLEALVERRKRGDISGDEYLAERHRIIYGP